MARAKVESHDHGTRTKGHGKAMTKRPYKHTKAKTGANDHINLPRRKHELKS